MLLDFDVDTFLHELKLCGNDQDVKLVLRSTVRKVLVGANNQYYASSGPPQYTNEQLLFLKITSLKYIGQNLSNVTKEINVVLSLEYSSFRIPLHQTKERCYDMSQTLESTQNPTQNQTPAPTQAQMRAPDLYVENQQREYDLSLDLTLNSQGSELEESDSQLDNTCIEKLYKTHVADIYSILPGVGGASERLRYLNKYISIELMLNIPTNQSNQTQVNMSLADKFIKPVEGQVLSSRFRLFLRDDFVSYSSQWKDVSCHLISMDIYNCNDYVPDTGQEVEPTSQHPVRIRKFDNISSQEQSQSQSNDEEEEDNYDDGENYNDYNDEEQDENMVEDEDLEDVELTRVISRVRVGSANWYDILQTQSIAQMMGIHVQHKNHIGVWFFLKRKVFAAVDADSETNRVGQFGWIYYYLQHKDDE